jgi:hypothetical protein
MSEATTTDHAGEDTAGRHRGAASAEEAERTVQPPLGKHRRPDQG